MRPRWPRASAFLASLSLAGCITVGPDYHPPPTNAPPAWNGLNPSGQPALTPGQAGDIASWWKRLDDPLLSELVEEALRASPDIDSARARLRQARAQRGVVSSAYYPDLSASGRASRSKLSGETGKSGYVDLYNVGFDASWELDVFGGIRRGVQAADADVQASVASLQDTQVTLAAEVATNYVEVRAQQELIRIAQQNLETQTETLQLTEWREQAGLASVQDVEQARTNREQTRAQIPVLVTNLAEAEHAIEILLGLVPGTLHARLESSRNATTVPDNVAVGIPADTLRQRPDVRAAERQLAAQTARVGVAEAARYPSFNLTGSIGLEALSLGALGNGDAGIASLAGGITAPIFNAGRLSSEVEVQDAIREQALVTYRKAVLGALQDVENALVEVSQNRDREQALNAAVESARIASTLARSRYSAGLIDFQSVLDTERTVLTVEESLARNQANGVQAVIRLYKSLGGGWSPSSSSTDKGTP